jgi:arylsulfatase A-like enzyme
MAKNFIMLSIDDMRSVNDWGNFSDLVVTPNMDRLAAMGTTFDRAVTQVPLCNPSRTSVLSGLEPSRTGVLDNAVGWQERVSPSDTLPGVLKSAGAYVAMFGKIFHDETPITAAQQQAMFDEFVMGLPSQGNAANVVHDSLWHDNPFGTGRYTGNDLRDEASVASAIDFLHRADNISDPFFLGVGIQKPHPAWWVPSRFFDLYDPAEVRAALQRSLDDGTLIPGAQEYADVPPMVTPSTQHAQIAANLDLWTDYIVGYLASVSYADAKVGQVLDALASHPALANDTAILLWSDNGYQLGDKNQWGKDAPWRDSTQVPMIFVDPDTPGGRHANQIVSLADIFPTVLDSMGVNAPGRLGLQGDSLLPIVGNPNVSWYNAANGRGIALTTIDGAVSMRVELPGGDDWRYTRYPDGTEEMYNLTLDRNEHVNRLNFRTGEGLTAADNAIHTTLSNLMDGQLAQNGYHLSTGSGTLRGDAGDDMFVTTVGAGTNSFVGGAGDDTYVLYRNATITEAANGGNDMIVFHNDGIEASFVIPANVETVQFNGVRFTGNGADNRLIGNPNSNTINGGGGNDTLLGLGGADTLLGGAGNDTLDGSFAVDRLTGGAGADRMTGGSAADLFIYTAVGDSTPGAADTIVDFGGPLKSGAGDRIDLSAIDANGSAAGNQAFSFGGTGIGHVQFVNVGGNTELQANTDTDAAIELRIILADGATQASAYGQQELIL